MTKQMSEYVHGDDSIVSTEDKETFGEIVSSRLTSCSPPAVLCCWYSIGAALTVSIRVHGLLQWWLWTKEDPLFDDMHHFLFLLYCFVPLVYLPSMLWVTAHYLVLLLNICQQPAPPELLHCCSFSVGAVNFLKTSVGPICTMIHPHCHKYILTLSRL